MSDSIVRGKEEALGEQDANRLRRAVRTGCETGALGVGKVADEGGYLPFELGIGALEAGNLSAGA